MKQVARKVAFETCARAAHEAVRYYRLALGDSSMPPWTALPPEAKILAVSDVASILAGSSASSLHAAWKHRKVAAGWAWGERLDAAKRTDPAMCPWGHLPEEDRRAFELQRAVVGATGGALIGGVAPTNGGHQNGRNGAQQRNGQRSGQGPVHGRPAAPQDRVR